MLNSKTVVLDVERFRHRKKPIVKDFGICTEGYLDCVLYLPPLSCSELTTHQEQSLSLLTRNLHKIKWETRDYPCLS